MEIVKTFYGRDNTVSCPSPVLKTDTLCEEPANDVTKKVMDLCAGENKCKIPVNVDFLGHEGTEICPGIRKFLRVVYRCTQHPKIVEECTSNCSKTCWPLCKDLCCHPPPPPTTPPPTPPPTTQPPQPPPVEERVTALSAEQSQEQYPQCPMPCSRNCAPLCLLSCCNPIPTELLNPRVPASAGVDVPKGFACPAPCSQACLPSCTIKCCRDSLVQATAYSQMQRIPGAPNQASYMQQNTQPGFRRSQSSFKPVYNNQKKNNIYGSNKDAAYNAAAAAWSYRSKMWHQKMQLARQAATKKAAIIKNRYMLRNAAQPYGRSMLPNQAYRYQYPASNYYGS